MISLRPAKWILPWLLLLSSVGAAPSPASETPQPDEGSYSRRVWRNGDGLPEDFAQAIAQTPDGYLWIGTSGGLVRFDGASFAVFNREQAPAFQDDSVYSLHVWQKAMDLVVECYKLTEKLPPTETYGLISSIRRACILVPAHIADGKGRDTIGEYLQKISAASGSLKLLETHLLVMDRLKYLPMSEIEPSLDLCDQVGKMLTRLTQSLRGGRS